jgi:ATP-binding cassette subfamily B (MDR/TAP) protein 7
VAEQGTHEQLINKAGLYTELWSAQETMFSSPEADVEGKEGGEGNGKIS